MPTDPRLSIHVDTGRDGLPAVVRERMAAHLPDVGPIHDDQPDTVTVVLEYLVGCAWHDLDHATRGGRWNIGAEHAFDTIVRAARVLGRATSIRDIPLPAVANGLYVMVLEVAGLQCPDSPDDVADVRASAQRYMDEVHR